MSRRLVPAAVAVLSVFLMPGGVAGEGPARSVDDELLRIGRQIPGFGGLFYDGQGRPAVYLLDPEGDGAAAVKSLGPDVRVLRGDYEFESLLAWRHEIRPLLGLPGVAFLDADEARNRVVVGVDSRAKGLDQGRLERELLAVGVPRGAVVFQETALFEDLVGVRDKLRPVPGGSQVVFNNFVCTLGFNAFRGNVFGFVVNSHCTNVRGAADGTRYSQSTPSGGGIGTEVVDPGFSTAPPCPAGRRCRMSDAAFAKYDKVSLGGAGKIARTLSGGTETGSLTLKSASARFTVTARTGSPLQGDTVHKMGRTTGWTFGTVIGTCVDANNGTDVTLFCQSVVRAGSGPGDSGSPVFYVLPGNKARLVGILWGGATDPVLGTLYAFSPLENIEKELGPLKVN
jgi:hypothetical protein